MVPQRLKPGTPLRPVAAQAAAPEPVASPKAPSRFHFSAPAPAGDLRPAPAGTSHRGSSWLDAVRGVLQDSPAAPTAAEVEGDRGALAVMREAVLVKDEKSRAEVIAWAKRIDAKTDAGVPSTVLEHTALTFLLSSGFFAHPEDGSAEPVALAEERKLNGEIRQSLERSLAASWKHLSGKDRPKDELLTRLPKSVLRKASREARVYHAAAFIPIGDLEAQRQASSLLRDYVPENQDLVVLGATLLAGAFNATAGTVIGATVLSHAMFSFAESLLHSNFAHSKGELGRWITRKCPKDAGWMQRAVHRALHTFVAPQMRRTQNSHEVVHHCLTFKKSFTEMFENPEHKAKVDAFIASLPPGEVKDLMEDQYGSTLNTRGVINVLLSSAPIAAALIAAGIAFDAPAAAYLPLILYSAAYVGSLSEVHPHLHDDKEEALKEAGPLMKLVLESRWAAWGCRNHWLHHKVDGNYNVSFPGADALLGVLFQPNLEDLFRMRDDGVLHY